MIPVIAAAPTAVTIQPQTVNTQRLSPFNIFK
jgi:hypothetical protein